MPYTKQLAYKDNVNNYKSSAWLFYILIALDQLLNAILGGYPDETISARCFREQRWQEKWIDRLFWLQRKDGKGHCEQCYEWEQERMDLPVEYRK